MKLLDRFRTAKESSSGLPESSATTNACMTVPSSPLTLFSGWLKHYLKQKRLMFRMIYGSRALREGAKGVLRGKRGSRDHMASSLAFIQGAEVIRGRPMNITIEPTNA